MRRALVRAGLPLAALVLVAGGFALWYFWPLFQMSPTDTGQVDSTEVLAVRNGHNAVFLLPDDEGYTAVDAGSAADGLIADLADQGIDPAEVHTVLLTHTDSDHVAALGTFDQARIVAGADDEQMIDGSERRNLVERSTLPDGAAERVEWVSGEQRIEAGWRTVDVIATPGHTPGSVSFLVDGTYLFTGDAARVAGGGLCEHPYTMDSRTAVEVGIPRLAESDLTTVTHVLSAHYGVHGPEVLTQSC